MHKQRWAWVTRGLRGILFSTRTPLELAAALAGYTFRSWQIWQNLELFFGRLLARFGWTMPGFISEVLPYALFFVVVVYTFFWPPRPSIEFYETREQMNERRGPIELDLRGASEVYAAWITGSTVLAKPRFPWSKIKQLILVSPEAPGLAGLAHPPQTTPEILRQQIRRVTETAWANRVEEVFWHPDIYTRGPMVIVNPRKRSAYVRIESQEYDPYNYVVTKRRHRLLFDRLQKDYQNLLGKSSPAPGEVG